MARLYSESDDVSLKLHRRIYNLDKINLFFLSEFTDEQGKIDAYSIDIEAANDAHYELDYSNTMKLAAFLGYPNCSTEQLADVLTEFFVDNGENEFRTILNRANAKGMSFHYSDYPYD